MLIKNSYNLIYLGLWIRTLVNADEGRKKEWVIDSLKALERQLESNSLPVSTSFINRSSQIQSIKAQVNALEAGAPIGHIIASKIKDEIHSLENVLFAESSIQNIYTLPERRFNSEYLLNTPNNLFKQGVFLKLDDIAKHDITSACRCLLFGEATAAAFLIIRATESTLKKYYFHHKKQNRLKNPMWGNMVSELKAKKTNRPSDGLLNSLDMIRVQFRNPTQHPEAVYEIDGVQDLFGVCIDVIGRMAIEI